METSIISYNVNGIRAATKKGFLDWLSEEDPDIVCIQETKAQPEQLDDAILNPEKYHTFWHSAQKKGYSGVSVFSKQEPLHVEEGCGIDKYDLEGRILRLDFDTFSVISAYFPSGSSGDPRQLFKEDFLKDFYVYIEDLKKKFPNLIITGDYNICHKPIDIHDPVGNKKSSGFLPHEREWVSSFIDLGFVDSFRKFNSEPHNYTWWSYRAQARQKNKGWRIDYQMATTELEDRLISADILPDVIHSDHCPTKLIIKN